MLQQLRAQSELTTHDIVSNYDDDDLEAYFYSKTAIKKENRGGRDTRVCYIEKKGSNTHYFFFFSEGGGGLSLFLQRIHKRIPQCADKDIFPPVKTRRDFSVTKKTHDDTMTQKAAPFANTQ